MSTLLEVKGLSLGLSYRHLTLVRDVCLELKKGEVLGIVGESGCGKSLTALSLMGLFPPGIKPYSGSVKFKDLSILELSEKELRKIRGKAIGMVLQDPLSALNPVLTIGTQLEEVITTHLPELTKSEVKERVVKILKEVGIPDPELRKNSYPHELSGGLRQRAMIGIALAADPELLIADEPTTALDPTVRIQILNLFRSLVEKKGLSLIFISHDLGVIRYISQRVAVFYAGEVVEVSPAKELFKNPLHPYTKLLLKSYPSKKGLEIRVKTKVFTPVEGFRGCRFWERCEVRCEQGKEQDPPMLRLGNREVRCFLYAKNH